MEFSKDSLKNSAAWGSIVVVTAILAVAIFETGNRIDSNAGEIAEAPLNIYVPRANVFATFVHTILGGCGSSLSLISILSWLGLILGITGLRSCKKTIALVGVVFTLIIIILDSAVSLVGFCTSA